MKKISLAVADFAVPVPRRGSIDVNSGYFRGQKIGQELHLKIQAQRISQFANYQAEVAIAHEFPGEKYLFEIRGRMDGLFASERPRIEEIKSTFNIFDLLRALKDAPDEHPYCLQVKTYGYLYWLKNKVIPDLRLHLVSSRNGETYDFDLRLDISVFENWLGLRLKELSQEAERDEKRISRRKRIARSLSFPFAKPRSGQIELIQTIEEGIEKKQLMLLQAPTGLGKTMGVLYPTLKEALTRGQKIVYLTPKNSQHAVAEEALERLRGNGVNLKSLTITAKSKICLKNEAICNPDYCEYAKDHYTKIADNGILEQLAKKRRFTAKTFKKLAEQYQVCPFELQLDAARDVDAVICDYNYVFAPRSSFGNLAQNGLVQRGKPNLVIDEAHNLPSRALDYYSPELSTLTLEKMREDTPLLPDRFRSEARTLIDRALSAIRKCGVTASTKPHQIAAPLDLFLDLDSDLRTFLVSYLAANIDIQAKDVVMRLCFYWSEFTAALVYTQDSDTSNRFFTTFSPNPDRIKITCCDASEMLKDSYDNYAHVVAFSATLKPFDYYSRLSGLETKQLKTAEFASPFPKSNRKLLIIPQISSKYSERDRNYPRIAETIERISALKKGNYVAFFPSFDFMDKVHAQLQVPEGVQFLKQERSMRRDDIENVLLTLKTSQMPHILFAVQGGVFSEGVDYPGNMVIGAFVIGPPLPPFDLEREKMREYYEEHYAAGFDYAYTFPAMAKAVQAAGRVIRSETDQGIIILMDNRFVQSSYAKSMPRDWFHETPREMISQSILKEIADFWAQAEPP